MEPLEDSQLKAKRLAPNYAPGEAAVTEDELGEYVAFDDYKRACHLLDTARGWIDPDLIGAPEFDEFNANVTAEIGRPDET